MTIAQPLVEMRAAVAEIGRCLDEVEGWTQDDEERATACRSWEKVIAIANDLFTRIVSLEESLQEFILNDQSEHEPGLDSEIRDILGVWLARFLKALPGIDQLEEECARVNGADVFRRNLTQAQAMLTPDDLFFNRDPMVRLRDQALDDHRSGRTEPLL